MADAILSNTLLSEDDNKNNSSSEEDSVVVPITEWPVEPQPAVSFIKGEISDKTEKQSHKRGHERDAIHLLSEVKRKCHEQTKDRSIKDWHCSAEVEPLARLRITKWWRRKNDKTSFASLPSSSNPNTILHVLSRMPECKDFLEAERRELLKRSQHDLYKNRADVHAALASIEDCLGNYKTALANILTAVELDPTNTEHRWWKEKLSRQNLMLSIQAERLVDIQNVPNKIPEPSEVERVSVHNLSVQEFHELYVRKRKPVILLDVVSKMTKSHWNLDYVKERAGNKRVTVKQTLPQSVEWARLEESEEISVAEFITAVQREKTTEYLFDWSLPLHCPELAKDLIIPSYFSDNFLQQTVPGSLYRDSWPSLFIAPKGATSHLHVDAFASNFWMALFEGQKRWTFFPEEDTPLLYPEYIHSMDPVFSVDLTQPDLQAHPLLALTTPRQCVLSPGELLFVPGGSPHFVENLTTSMAVSSNHVDGSNYQKVCEELRINGLLDPTALDLLQQLSHNDFVQRVNEVLQGEHVENILS